MLPLKKSKSSDDKKNNSNGSLYFLIIVSILWVLALIYLLVFSKACDYTEFASAYRLDIRYLSCRTSNELGDFLAGAFAPLAFLWLAGAVFIQTSELRAQRQELQLSRRQMEVQSDAIKAQAEEVKASTGYIAQQTSILKREHDIREQEKTDEQYLLILDIIRKLITTQHHATLVLTNGTINKFRNEFISFDGFHGNAHEFLRYISFKKFDEYAVDTPNELFETVAGLRKYADDDLNFKFNIDFEKLIRFTKLVEDLGQLVVRLSPARKSEISHIDFQLVIKNLEILNKLYGMLQP